MTRATFSFVHSKHSSNIQGFSLVELAIVLVILGLLAGGVMAGRHLIHAAGLHAVVREATEYHMAVMTFRQKYLALPGDMSNATAFWSETGNGNGNRQIDLATEQFLFWQHLANAGLIAGSYTGLAGSGGAEHHIIGENCPASRMRSNVGWGVRKTLNGFEGYADLWAQYPAHSMLRLGAQSAASILSGNIFTPEEAWAIDRKMDDGKPASGIMWSRTWQNCTTATTATDYQADYNIAHPRTACALFLILQ